MKHQKYSNDAMSIRNFINKVNYTGKCLKEAFESPSGQMPPQGEEEYYDNEEMPSEATEMNEEEEAGKQYVDQIRKAAIQGIASFANNVDSPSYEFFKKVFMMADKVLSEKENNEEV